jgi:hypothetical protein
MKTPHLDFAIAHYIKTSSIRPLNIHEKEMLKEFQEIKKQLKTTNEIHKKTSRN